MSGNVSPEAVIIGVALIVLVLIARRLARRGGRR